MSNMRTKQPGHAVLYARVSSKQQEEEGFSIPAQLKLLREYAIEHGLNVTNEFVDVETAKRAGRTSFGEMVDAFWLTALLDPTRQKDVHAVAQALAAELLGESYIGEHILLEPPPKEKATGDYRLGWVTYARRSVCSFGLPIPAPDMPITNALGPDRRHSMQVQIDTSVRLQPELRCLLITN